MRVIKKLDTTELIDQLIDFILYEVLHTTKGSEKIQDQYIIFLYSSLRLTYKPEVLVYAGIENTPKEYWTYEDTLLGYSILRIKASELRKELRETVYLITGTDNSAHSGNDKIIASQIAYNNSMALSYINKLEYTRKKRERDLRKEEERLALLEEEERHRKIVADIEEDERLFNEKSEEMIKEAQKRTALELEREKVLTELKVTSLASDDKELDLYLESVNPKKKPWWKM